MIGSRIAALRKAKNMSQTQLGIFLCVSASTVGMYEQGRRMPGVETLVQLAELFDVSLDYLITGKEWQSGRRIAAGRYELTWQENGSLLLRPVE